MSEYSMDRVTDHVKELYSKLLSKIFQLFPDI